MNEPEYVIIQPGLGGVAWLGEVIDGELSPIGTVADLLAQPAATSVQEGIAAAIEAAPSNRHKTFDGGHECISQEYAAKIAREFRAPVTEPVAVDEAGRSGRWGVTLYDLNRTEIEVTMSSLATEPAVRIYVGYKWHGGDSGKNYDGECAHLGIMQAKTIRDALSNWLERESPAALPVSDDTTTDETVGEPSRSEVDRVARLLIAEWERIESEPVNPSRVANFADMARVVLAVTSSPVGGVSDNAGLRAAIEVLHQRVPGVYQKLDWCRECERDWPCATAAVLAAHPAVDHD